MSRVKLPTEPKDWEKLVEEMVSEANDRTAVILGGAFVDAALEKMLLSWLLPEAKVEEFFDATKNGSISTFGAKTNLGYAMGLISPEELKQVKAIGQIRNVFAHHLMDATFDHPDLKKPLNVLRTMRQGDYKLAAKDTTSRLLFVRAVRELASSFHTFRSLEPRTVEQFRKEAEKRVSRDWRAVARAVARRRRSKKE